MESPTNTRLREYLARIRRPGEIPATAATDRAARRGSWRSAARRPIAKSLAASGVAQLGLIVSGVLVARSLGPEDRGYLALLVMVAGIFALIGTIGLPYAATYFIARDRSQARDIASSLVGPAILLMGVTLVLQAGVLTAIVVGDPDRVKIAAVVSLLLVPAFPAFAYGTAILQGQQRFTAFNVLRTLPTVAYVAGVAAAFLLGSADLVSLMIMWTGANVVGGFLALGVAARGLPPGRADKPPPSRSQVTKFGLKSVLGSLSPIDSFRLDQAIVGLFLNPVALGLYVVAQAATNLPRIVAASIGMVAYPQVASHSDPAAARRAMWKYFSLGVALFAVVVGALEVLVGPLITFFFGNEFAQATPIARLLLLAAFFQAARRVLTDGVNGLGYPGLGTVAEVASWIILFPALAMLLPGLGVNGVAWALVIAWGASLLLLLALVAMTATRGPFAAWRRLGIRPSLVSDAGYTPLIMVFAVAAVVGVAVASLPDLWAFAVVLALCVALLVAFGRTAIHHWTSRAAMAFPKAGIARKHGYEVTAPQAEAEFRTARRLYYVGIAFLALLTIRVGGQLTVSDLLFAVSFVVACAELIVLRRRIPVRLPALLLLGMALFSIGGVFSTFESYEPVKSIAVVGRFIFLTVFWFWLGTIVLHRREHVTKALTLWVASAAVCGAAGILQIMAGNIVPGTTDEFGRATGFTTQSNDLGGITSIAFVPALMLAARPGLAASQRMLSYGLLLLIAAGLVVSGSVGGLLAAAVATVVWIALQRSSVHSLMVFAALGLSLLAVVTVQAMRGAPTPLDRLNTVTNSSAEAGQGAGSLDSRIATYRVATKAIEEHPFIGVGLDLVSVTKPEGVVSYQYDVHNLIIGVWYKAGLVGLLGLLISLLATLRTGWSAALQQTSPTDRRIAIALVSAVFAFIAFAMSAPVLFSRYAWVPAALLLALRGVQRRGLLVSRVRVHRADAWRPARLRGSGLVTEPGFQLRSSENL
jgi:O-antigen/teichoic acid export membrane protein/O-antigen ligase